MTGYFNQAQNVEQGVWGIGRRSGRRWGAGVRSEVTSPWAEGSYCCILLIMNSGSNTTWERKVTVNKSRWKNSQHQAWGTWDAPAGEKGCGVEGVKAGIKSFSPMPLIFIFYFLFIERVSRHWKVSVFQDSFDAEDSSMSGDCFPP